MSTNKEWICTDPDNLQFGRKISDGVYEFREWSGDEKPNIPDSKPIKECFDIEGEWHKDEIVLADYSEEEIFSHISAYYSSVEELKEICGEDFEWIIAECIFEQESGKY